jgi:hypothetical protein
LDEFQNFRLAATSINGKLLFSETIQHKGGNQQYRFPVKNLPNGLFYVILFNEKQELLHIEKVIKQ